MSDECDADIDGGCGACEKCDPEFWLQKSKERIAELETENARMREALNYYAEKKHYVQFPFLLGPCTEDGEIARKALGGEG